jgi:hypothetical protein
MNKAFKCLPSINVLFYGKKYFTTMGTGDIIQCTPFTLAMLQPSGPELMDLLTELGGDLHYKFFTECLQTSLISIVLKQNK